MLVQQYLAGEAITTTADDLLATLPQKKVTSSSAQALPDHWYEASAEWKKAIETAFAASPDADIAKWKSPVLLIHGDDDRNVPFDQTVELAHRLEQQHTQFEELIIPNDIHGFLRWMNWLQADQATVQFLSRQLEVKVDTR